MVQIHLSSFNSCAIDDKSASFSTVTMSFKVKIHDLCHPAINFDQHVLTSSLPSRGQFFRRISIMWPLKLIQFSSDMLNEPQWVATACTQEDLADATQVWNRALWMIHDCLVLTCWRLLLVLKWGRLLSWDVDDFRLSWVQYYYTINVHVLIIIMWMTYITQHISGQN